MTKGAVAPYDRDKIGRCAWRRLLGCRCAASPRCRCAPDRADLELHQSQRGRPFRAQPHLARFMQVSASSDVLSRAAVWRSRPSRSCAAATAVAAIGSNWAVRPPPSAQFPFIRYKETVAASGARGGGEMVAKAQTGTRSGPNTTAARARRRRTGAARRVAKKPSVIQRVARVVWVSPRHVALALATGLVCGSLASRIDGMISPPYAAILGTLVVYPTLIAMWRRMPQPGWRRR